MPEWFWRHNKVSKQQHVVGMKRSFLSTDKTDNLQSSFNSLKCFNWLLVIFNCLKSNIVVLEQNGIPKYSEHKIEEGGKPCVCTSILQIKRLNQQHLAIWHLQLALSHKQGVNTCMHEEMWLDSWNQRDKKHYYNHHPS